MKFHSLIVAFFLILQTGIAQNTSTKKAEFGILLGTNISDLILPDYDATFIEQEYNVSALSTSSNYGFSLGVLGKYNINSRWSVSPQSILSFKESSLLYHFVNGEHQTESIEAVNVEVPFHIVYTSAKSEKVNFSATIGPRYIHHLAADSESLNLDLKSSSLSFDIGAGAEIKSKHFKMKPEIMVSMGLLNLKNEGNDIYNGAINSLKEEVLTFRLLFFG